MKDDLKKQYDSTLKGCFENIRNFVSANLSSLNDFSKFYNKLDSILVEDDELNAEVYYFHIRLGLTNDSIPLIDLTLNSLKKLVNDGFIKGTCLASIKGIVKSHRALVIDEIIEDITTVFSMFTNENIVQSISKLLYSISKAKLPVHGDSLSKIIKLGTQICLTVNKSQIESVVKNSLNHFFINAFALCELHNDKRSASQKFNYTFGGRFTNYHSITSNLVFTYVPRSKVEIISEQVLRVLIDKVEISSLTGTNVNKIIPKNENECLNHVFFDRFFVNSGKFGWCVICKERANFYCVKTRLPVCSLKCKNQIALLDQETGCDDIMQDEGSLYLMDCALILKSLATMLKKEISKDDAINSKFKMVSLELINSFLSQPGSFFINEKKLITILREDIFECLLISCTSLDKDIFSLTLSVMFNMWNSFREHIKTQLGVMLENVFLNVLNSENSSFIQKELVLEWIYKLTKKPKAFVELYINFDCDLEETEVMNKLLTAMCRIARGSYAAVKHQLSENEQLTLKNKAIDALISLIRGIEMYVVDQAGSGLSERQKDHFDTDLSVSMENNDMKEKLDFARKRKSAISTGLAKFNIKPKNGIKYLVENEIVDDSPKSIGQFLKSTVGLNKELLGEYLGHKENGKILEGFLEEYDFKDMSMITSLRLFLSDFKLPGEGQIIDRIISAFSLKFYKDNSKELSSDNVYYVAFATIMLQTNLHNENVKEKMNKSGFYHLVRTFDTEAVIKEEYLDTIYEEIQKSPLSLAEFDREKAIKEIMRNSSKKKDFFVKESLHMLSQGQDRIKKSTNKQFITNFEVDQIVPLMETAWSAFLGVFSQILDNADVDDIETINKATSSLSNCIQILGLLGLDLQKEAVFQGLYKFTNLNKGKPIGNKSISCLEKVLALAENFSKLMKGCWMDILTLLSAIDFYHSLKGGSRNDLEVFVKQCSRTMSEKEISFEKQNIDVIVGITSPDKYENIYNKTKSLDLDSLRDFILSLTKISRSELENEERPRIFSLQRLVEVAELNMNRPSRFGKEIWTIVSDYLVEVGCNKNMFVAGCGIDSLRQLARKYLRATKINNNQVFLEPFEKIILTCLEEEYIIEYIVASLNNLILNEVTSIKTGWRVVFSIFQIALSDSSEDNKGRIFESLKVLVSNNFEEIKDYFLELTQCLRKFSIMFPKESLMLLYETIDKIHDDDHLYALFSNLSNIISINQDDTQRLAISTFFNILNMTEIGMNDFLFKKIFNLLLVPLIEDLIKTDSADELDQIMLEISNFTFKKTKDPSIFLSDIFDQLINITKLIRNKNVLIAINVIKYILIELKNTNSTKLWDVTIDKICKISSEMLPKELGDLDLNNLTQDQMTKVDTQLHFCIIQHNLISIISTLIEEFYSQLTRPNVIDLISCLSESYNTAFKFNKKIDLRIEITRRNDFKFAQPVAFYIQQCNSANVIQSVFQIMIEEGDEMIETVLTNSIGIIKDFIFCIAEKFDSPEAVDEHERLLNHLASILNNNVFPILNKISVEKYGSHKQIILRLLLELIPCSFEKVRINTKELLSLLILI